MENLHDITELIGCGVLVFDEDLKIRYANRRAGELFGVSPSALLRRSIEDVEASLLGLRGEELREDERPFTSVVSGGERMTGREFTLQRADGSRCCISLNAIPVFNEDNAVGGLVVDFDPRCSCEERLEQFIGAMDEIVFELDGEGRYLNVWTDNEDLLKRPRQDLLQMRVDDVIPTELAEKVHAAFHRIRNTGQPETLEYEMEVPGGTRWFLARIALVPNPGDRESTYAFLARDITAQKELEQSLGESERRFRGVFENAATGIAIVGLDGRCLKANESLHRLLGYTSEELKRYPFSTYSHPQELPADLEQFQRLTQGEIDSYSMEKRFFRKEGGEIWAHLTVAMVRDEVTGAPLYGIAIVEDITRRKQVETEKDHLLNELEAIFVSAAEGIILYDEEGNILRMNDAAQEITGYGDAERAMSMADRFRIWAPLGSNGRPIELTESALYRAFKGETVKGEILQYQGKERRRSWVSFSASPLFDAAKRQTGAVATMTDITRLRELQDQMENYLHMLAHDLRSPLTIISGHAQLLRDTLRRSRLEEASQLSAQSILQGTEQIQKMIEDLVEIGRLESGQTALHYELIDLREFIDHFLRRHQVSEEYRRVRVEIPSDLPPVSVGIHHLERFIGNLIDNALKYSASDQSVEVGAWRADGRVCLSVTDHGEGIAPGELPRIFDRFYRSSNARRQAGGTGLGLYITKNLVEAYGGSIWVRSTLGEGSRFTLCLPEAPVK